MGLYKRCGHVGRSRDRCEHGWWGRFRGRRVSLAKWTGREIRSKAEADAALDELRAAIREGTFDERGLQPPLRLGPLSFREFATVYKERHAIANGLALANTIDYRLKPLLDHFGDRPLAEIRTADVEDFIADLRKPRIIHRHAEPRLTGERVDQPHDRTAAAHAELGGRRVSTSTAHRFDVARRR